MATVTIDGKTCEAQAGETILTVATRAGVWIPTLCHHPALEPYASCRICSVEIDRGGWWQVVTSCNYPVRGDLVVRVNSERAVRARQGVIQLLLARCPESPELRVLAARMGVQESGFPTLTTAQRNCILCGLCVRVCEERIGVSAISLVGRGVDRSVATPFKLASEVCIGCGACAAICPVGTIVVRIDGQEAEIIPFETRVKLLRCAGCGRTLGSELFQQALAVRGGPTLAEMLAQRPLCPNCKRENLAARLSAAVSSDRDGRFGCAAVHSGRS
jgi:predicted molibdopterin-dependent oxidoreductase YjgC